MRGGEGERGGVLATCEAPFFLCSLKVNDGPFRKALKGTRPESGS